MFDSSVRLRACLVVALSLTAPVGARGQTTARDTLPVTRRVEIEGNERFSNDEIKRRIVTRASGCKSVFLAPFCWFGLGTFQRTERLDPRELRTDVARIRVFYFRRGFRQAQVDTIVVRERNSVDVTFRIGEGEPVVVRDFQVEGLEPLGGIEAIGLSNLPLKIGEPFSEIDLTTSLDRIETALQNRGYAEAAVLREARIPVEDTLAAYVILRAEPGPRSTIGKIEISGTTDVSSEDMKRLVTFRSGDVYSKEEILRSQRQLYSMALFDYVAITTQPSASDSTIDVLVQVNEADSRAVQFGFGVSTTECLQLEAGWAHRNFFGGTRKLELTGVLSNLGTAALAQQFPCSQAGVPSEEEEAATNPYNKVNWRLRADFQQPWFLGTENWLHLGVFTERQSLPAIYARVSYGGDVRLSREISPGTAVIGTWRPGRDSLEEGSADFLWCANFGVCSPGDIETLSETRWLSWISATLARSKTDAVLSPSRGYRFTVEGEFASRFTGSEWAYYRAAGEISWFQQVGSRNVLALRLRGAAVRPIGSGLEGIDLAEAEEAITHPLKRQYAGGAFTVRGFGQNLLGPKTLLADSADLAFNAETNPSGCDPGLVTEGNNWVCDPVAAGVMSNEVFPRPTGGENALVANIELRVPFVSRRWVGVVFLDLGKVWTLSSKFGTAEDWAWSPGVGIRYLSPVGPLRLDVGYNTRSTEQLPMVSAFDGGRTIVKLIDEGGETVLYDYNPFEDTGLREFVNRLQLHFSIGHAF